MNLTSQVISLPLAKRLKELGCRQKALCYYQGTAVEIGAGMGYVMHIGKQLTWEGVVSVAAFTVAELLNMAPASTSLLKRTDIETDTIPRYYVETFEHYRDKDYDENPAEALGLMLAYLIENHLITV